MKMWTRAGAIKIAAALLLLGTLALSAVIVPDHLARHESKERCLICRLIHHMPLLEPGFVADIVSLFQHKEFLFSSDDVSYRDPKSIRNFTSRAPPLS